VSDPHPEVELWLDERKGWLLRVPAKVPDSALKTMMAYAVTVYTDMHRKMPDGLRRRRLERAIGDLIKLKITQVVRPKVVN
jgi:hypothetical protein